MPKRTKPTGRKPPDGHDGATFVGILLGLMLGVVYTLGRIKRRGAVNRRDLTGFGAASGELEMEASMDEAKSQARARLDSRD